MLIIDFFKNEESRKTTLIQLLEIVLGKNQKENSHYSIFSILKEFDSNIARNLILQLLYKNYLLEQTMGRSKISYSVIKFNKSYDINFELTLTRTSAILDESLKAIEIVKNKNKYHNFENCFLNENNQIYNLSNADLYSELNDNIRNARKETMKTLLQDPVISELFQDNQITIDSILPSQIIHHICIKQPNTKKDFFDIIKLPKEFGELENKILEIIQCFKIKYGNINFGRFKDNDDQQTTEFFQQKAQICVNQEIDNTSGQNDSIQSVGDNYSYYQDNENQFSCDDDIEEISESENQ